MAENNSKWFAIRVCTWLVYRADTKKGWLDLYYPTTLFFSTFKELNYRNIPCNLKINRAF
jgi:hypothetical protein